MSINATGQSAVDISVSDIMGFYVSSDIEDQPPLR